MTDTAAAPTVEPGGITFSPEAVTAMRQAWVAQGLDPTAFDAAAASPSAAAPAAAPAPAPMADEPSADRMETSLGTLTLAQVTSMADDLMKAGVTEEAIRAALAADGIEAEMVEDTRTADQVELDRLHPPAAAADYRADYASGVLQGADAQTVAEYDAAARGALAAMGITKETGGHLISEILAVGQRFGRMDEAGRAEYGAGQKRQLERLSGGPEAAATRIAAAGKVLARCPPAFRDAMKASGVLDNAAVVNWLAFEADLQALRG